MKRKHAIPRVFIRKWLYLALHLTIIIIGSAFMIWRFDILQQRQLEEELKDQSTRLEESLNEITTYTENALRYVSYDMVKTNNFNNINSIHRSFDTIKIDKKLNNLISQSGVGWADKNYHRVFVANTGLSNPNLDLSSRDYMPLTLNQSGKLHMGRAILENTSGSLIFPAGFGVDNKYGQYTGALVVDFDITKLARIFKKSLITPGINVSLIDDSLKPVLLIDSKEPGITEKDGIRKWLKEVDFNRNYSPSYMEPSFLRFGKSYYFYQMTDHPYIIFISHNKKLDSSQIAKIFSDNTSDFIVIIICIIILIYFLQHTSAIKFSLSGEYLVFAVVITCIATAIMIFLLISFYRYQDEDKKYRYSIEAEKIINGLGEQFSFIENLARFVGERISSLNKYDAKTIANELSSGNNIDHPKHQDVFSWSLFDFIDVNGNVIASGSQGVFTAPKHVTDRSYMQDAPKRPWKLYFSEPSVGITSGEFVLPAGFAITDKKSLKYIGILSMGININRLARKLEGLLASENTNFVILNKDNGKLILQSSGNLHNLDWNFFVDKINYINTTQSDSGMLPNAIEYNDVVYRYFRNSYSYPYTVLIGESNHYLEQRFNKEMLPRLIEFISFWLFVLVLLFFFRLKIVSPLIGLSNAAKDISEGKSDVKIPHVSGVETIHLAKSILHVKRAFLREKRLKVALKQAKESAEAANTAKTDFLYSTAHELRSPLTAIIGFSQMIKTKIFGADLDKYSEYAADIEQSGNELMEFIVDLLDVNKTETGNFELEHEEWLDIRNVIQRAVKLNVSRANNINIRIILHIENNLPKIFADGRRLRQILVNLISNSIKYSPKDTTIKISAMMRDDRMTVIIADQGFGMNDNQLAIALTKWGKVENKNSGKVDSHGLGLPLAKHLAELHGAELMIESTPDKGTIVTIIFPESRIATHNQI